MNSARSGPSILEMVPSMDLKYKIYDTLNKKEIINL